MWGIGALYDILNKMRDTEVQPPIKSPGFPGNFLDQEGSQPTTPDEQGPLSVPSNMKKCSDQKDRAPSNQSGGGVADARWGLVRQDLMTG